MDNLAADRETQSKVISLFQFIEELNKLKQKSIVNVKDNLWHYMVSNIPEDQDNICVYYRDRVEEEASEKVEDSEDVLLSVHKPEFQRVPEPEEALKEWLEPGWEDYRNEVSIKASIERITNDSEGEPFTEWFRDEETRVEEYEAWLPLRKEWAKRQKLLERTRDFFSELYRLYFELQRI